MHTKQIKSYMFAENKFTKAILYYKPDLDIHSLYTYSKWDYHFNVFPRVSKLMDAKSKNVCFKLVNC